MKCTKCNQERDPEKDFYMMKGYRLKTCKKCVIKRNAAYQKKYPNKYRSMSLEQEQKRKIYMRKYYEKNKEKMREYNMEFLKRNPEYHKLHRMKKKEFLIADKDFID